jgi:hypothetical protein
MRFITMMLAGKTSSHHENATPYPLLALLTLLVTVPASPIQKRDDVRFTFRNNCGFDVYVREAVAQHPSSRPGETCQDYGESQDVLIKSGGEYYTTFPVLKDSCGHSGTSQ